MQISFDPIISGFWLYALIGLSILSLIIYIFANQKIVPKRNIILRSILCLGILLSILNPISINAKLEPIIDIATIIIDKSPSMSAANRDKAAQKALEAAKQSLLNRNIEPIIIESKTNINDALANINNNIDPKRLGGIIYIGDGINKINTIPNTPFHHIIIGKKNEFDPYLKLIGAPYNVGLNEEAKIKLKLIDETNSNKYSSFNIYNETGIIETQTIETNKEITFNLPIKKRGENSFAFEVKPSINEVSKANNAISLKINGELDRLRVLLVTGVPNEGTRAWRELLKSDANIDMVHFTILRTPDKYNLVPEEELSLIPFPIDELFDTKLNSFDLIIFDRFKSLDAIPSYYINRIKSYITNGGAFLMLAGPDEANSQGVMTTSLSEILPLKPIKSYKEDEFKAQLSDLGKRHPITKNLENNYPNWGKWRGLNIAATTGQTLLENDTNPVFIIDETQKGRIAVFLSDTPWLWQRGYDNGGPFRDLFKRTIHWLMKDPKLDNIQTIIETKGDSLDIKIYGAAQNLNIMLNNQNFTTKTIDGYEALKFNNVPFGLNILKIEDKTHYINIGNTETFTDLRVKALNINGTKLYSNNGEINQTALKELKFKSNKQSNIISQTLKPLIDNRIMALILGLLALLTWFIEGRKPRPKSQ